MEDLGCGDWIEIAGRWFGWSKVGWSGLVWLLLSQVGLGIWGNSGLVGSWIRVEVLGWLGVRVGFGWYG
jgi:hypothetical protein